MEKELRDLVPATMQVTITATPERKYSVWISGSTLSSPSAFAEMWITEKEYDVTGPTVVHIKCMLGRNWYCTTSPILIVKKWIGCKPWRILALLLRASARPDLQ